MSHHAIVEPSYCAPLQPLHHPQRWIARRSNRWMSPLLGSSACALVLMATALCYRGLHPTVSHLAGTTPRTAVPSRIAFASDPAEGHPRSSNPFAARAHDFTGEQWMNDAPSDHPGVRAVDTSPSQPDPAQSSISAALHVMHGHKSRTGTELVVSSHSRHSAGAGKLKFRPYRLRPQDAAPQIAEERHFASESVMPLGASGAYIMPTLRPAQREEETPY
jgi:hypothetical protein